MLIRTVYITGLVILLVHPAGSASAAPPIVGDPALLKVLQDAHVAALSSLSRGEYRAIFEETRGPPDFTNRADAIVAWDGDSTRTEGSLHLEHFSASAFMDHSPTGKLRDPLPEDHKKVTDSPFTFIKAPHEALYYIESTKRADYWKGGQDSLHPPEVVLLRPDQAWFMYSGRRGDGLEKQLFLPGSSRCSEIAITQLQELVKVTWTFPNGLVTTSTFNLSQGGNVVLTEQTWTGAAREKPDASEHRATWEWKRHDERTWILVHYHCEETQPNQNNRKVLVSDLQVQDFRSAPRTNPAAFSFSSFKFPGEVSVTEHSAGAGGKTEFRGYRHRSSPREIEEDAQKALDGFAEKLKTKGFGVDPNRKEGR